MTHWKAWKIQSIKHLHVEGSGTICQREGGTAITSYNAMTTYNNDYLYLLPKPKFFCVCVFYNLSPDVDLECFHPKYCMCFTLTGDESWLHWNESAKHQTRAWRRQSKHPGWLSEGDKTETEALTRWHSKGSFTGRIENQLSHISWECNKRLKCWIAISH